MHKSRTSRLSVRPLELDTFTADRLTYEKTTKANIEIMHLQLRHRTWYTFDRCQSSQTNWVRTDRDAARILLVCIGKHDDDDSDNECTDFLHTKETHSHWHTTLSSDIQCVDLCEILDWFFVDNHSRRFVLLSYVSVALFVLCICSTCFGVCAPIQIYS